MLEKDRIRHLTIQLADNGAYSLTGTIDSVFVNEEGRLIATKPGSAGVSMHVEADHPLHGVIGAVADAAIDKLNADKAERRRATEEEAKRAAEAAEKAAQRAAEAAERAKG